jgi:hypothetical protein
MTRLFPALALALLLLDVAPASAARLLKYSVLVDGKVVYVGQYTDDGLAGKARVWSYLEQVKFRPQPDAPVKADEALRHLIRGKVTLKAEHASQVIAEAALSEIMLLKDDPQSPDWKLAPEEIERTARLAGVGPLPDDEAGVRTDRTLWIIVSILVVVVGALFVFRGRDRDQRPPEADA